MSFKIIDGKEIADSLRGELAKKADQYSKKYGKKPTLAVVKIGDNPATKIYVNMKEKACNDNGIEFIGHYHEKISEEELIELIENLNNDEKVNAILVQLPLPEDIDDNEIIEKINPEKDVDGFTYYNVGSMYTGTERLLPCTPLGVIRMLERSGIEIEGKHAVIIGRSNIVGKPLAALFLKRHATVTVCHSRTKNLKEHTRNADILCAATGVPKMVKASMVKKGAVVIDIGISRVDGKVVGDVDFDNVKEKASYITPVPGGVGPMTITMVIHNTLQAALSQKGEYL